MTDWTYHSAVYRQNTIAYPIDLEWALVPTAARRADVFHHRQFFRDRFGIRPSVIHHHGTYFRDHYPRLLREQRARHAIGLAATLDLWLLAPDELEWLPAPYDGEWLRAFRKPSEALTIAHAPTNRSIKGTAAFLAAIERLGRLLPVRLLLIEGKPWDECLRLKGTADIYYDQVGLGYGNNAVEAMGMGIPVVAGGAEATLLEMTRRFGKLPFYAATEDTIYYALLDLASSRFKRTYWGRLAREHFDRFHDDRVVVEQLKDIYRRAAA